MMTISPSPKVTSDHQQQQYTSIDDHQVQDRFKSASVITQRPPVLPFPFTVFPFTLVTAIVTGVQFSVNRLLNLPRFGQYYKTGIQMHERCRNVFRWRPTSEKELDQAEQKILSHLKCQPKGYYVDIGKGWNLESVKIWTLEIPPKGTEGTENNATTPNSKANEAEGLPLVMVHGFASGSALWALNLDELSLHGKRRIYAFDLLGFAKSSRPKFNFPKFPGLTKVEKENAEVEAMEEYMVDSIEKWRQAIGAPLDDKFVLLGHSFGGYLSTAYALRYPDRVAHVILADPWGFPSGTDLMARARQLPFWVKGLVRLFMETLTPLAGLRAVGPWGPRIINSLRPDLKKRFERLYTNGEEEVPSDVDGMIMNYIYHCNAQAQPSGEIAFQKLCTRGLPWARMPMLERITGLKPEIALSFIIGSRSWIDQKSGHQAKEILANANNKDNEDEVDDDEETTERVNVHIMQDASHHVYADNPEEFNQLVLDICTKMDLQMLPTAMTTEEGIIY